MAEKQQGKRQAFGLGPDRRKLHARARPVPGAISGALAKTWDRLAEIEARFAALHTEGQVREWLRKEHNITISQANRLIRRARKRWQDEASAKGREERIAELDATTREGIRRALERQGLALDREGGEHWYPNPDVGAAVRGVELLARLHGDLAQPSSSVLIGFGDEAVKAIAQIYGVTEAPPAIDAEGEAVSALPSAADDG